jgi:hypothetical protein
MAKRRCVFSIKLSTGKQVDFTKKQLMTLMASDQAFVLRDIAKENDIKLTPSEGAEIRQILAGQAKKLKESEAKQEATAEALKEQKKEFTEEKKEMREIVDKHFSDNWVVRGARGRRAAARAAPGRSPHHPPRARPPAGVSARGGWHTQ